MAMQLRQGGAWQTISAAKLRASGAWRTIKAIQVYADGAWRLVANFTPPSPPPPTGGGGGGGGGTGGGGVVTLSISPSPFSKTSIHNTMTSQLLTATPSGGLTPYTYAWTVVTSTVSVTINNPTLASASATATVADLDSETCTLRCTVTDNLGVTAHADVNGTFTNNNTGTL